MSIWASLITFDDSGDPEDRPPPLVYLTSGHVPRVDDRRGGQIDVAALPIELAEAGTYLRIGLTTVHGRYATVVVDAEQAAAIVSAMSRWLHLHGHDVRAECGGCRVATYVEAKHGCTVHDADHELWERTPIGGDLRNEMWPITAAPAHSAVLPPV